MPALLPPDELLSLDELLPPDELLSLELAEVLLLDEALPPSSPDELPPPHAVISATVRSSVRENSKPRFFNLNPPAFIFFYTELFYYKKYKNIQKSQKKEEERKKYFPKEKPARPRSKAGKRFKNQKNYANISN